MGRYLLGRLAAAVPTLVLLTLAAFLLNVAAKGDPALLALKAGGQDPTPEAVAAYREKLGLNDPLPVRYVTLGRQRRSRATSAARRSMAAP